jgi:hypothetical protein
LDARPGLGRETHLLAKHLREVALAPACALRYLLNHGHAGSALKALQGEVHERIAGEAAGEALQQKLLQKVELLKRGRDFAQAVAQGSSGEAPYFFETRTPIAEKIHGIRRERGEAAGMEDDADQVSHVRCVDNLKGGAGSDDERWGHPVRGLVFRAIEQKIAVQVEDYLNPAGGQNALPAMRCVRNLRIPERTNALVERSGRSVLKENQLILVVVIARRSGGEKRGSLWD